MKKIYTVLILALLVLTLPSCIEDSFSTSPSDQPQFSTDTLQLGDVFTLDMTPTHRITVRNRCDKMLNISNISLRDDADELFRLNVDGMSGRSFSNVEIRPNDSIFVFVEATLPENGTASPVEFTRHLDFVTNGVTSTVVLNIQGQDAIRCDGLTISANTLWDDPRPYLIRDTLRVAQGATLTLAPGTTLRFHDKAAMKVEGTLVANGTADRPVEMLGDRNGQVVGSIAYELMSGQWGGVYFESTSRDNRLTHTSIRNSNDGLTLAPADTGDAPVLTAINCQIRNTTNYVIDARHANLKLIGCELADASNGILRLNGGSHIVNHCTIANYYLFTALGDASVSFDHLYEEYADADYPDKPYLKADFSNTIIYGNGYDLSHGDLDGTGVYLRRCLLKSAGEDDEHFVNCLWDTDPLYYTERLEYYFDYRLKPESPAIGASDPALDVYGFAADRYGVASASPADLGAYTYVAPPEE